MPVLLGSQFILYTHLIITGIISTVLCRNLIPWISLQNTTKQTNPRPVLWSNNFGKLSSRLILRTYHTDLSIRGPEKIFRKETYFYPMFPELIFHKISLWRNIYLHISLEQGWGMLSHFLTICFLWTVVSTRSYLLVSPVLGTVPGT